MTTKPARVRVARGTLLPLAQPAPTAAIDVEADAAPMLRMTIQPPRTSTTTPGVIRRLPR